MPLLCLALALAAGAVPFLAGTVYYMVAGARGLQVPLTRRMFEQGYVYVQTFDKPNVESRNDGLKINQ